MATIYDMESGNTITDGLQGSKVCDEAVIAARRIAAERDAAVLLEDDGEETVVAPDGTLWERDAWEAA